jgi:hypothetical protein
MKNQTFSMSTAEQKWVLHALEYKLGTTLEYLSKN